MNNSLTFLYVVFFLSIAMYVFAAVITMAFVIPLQFKQAKVKNGLVKLRRQMLSHGVFTEIVSLASIAALTLRFFIHDPTVLRYLITSIILLHAVGTISKAIIFYNIYHSQYSIENVILHEKMARREKKRK